MDESWSIDIPGLTRERAAEIRELLLPDSPFGVVLLDPAEFMVRGFDRSTVELLIKCLEAGLAADDMPHEDQMGALSMLEDCRDWLPGSSD